MPAASTSTQLAQAIRVMRLLREREWRAQDLATTLGVTPRTAHRLLASIAEAGIEVRARHSSREVYHSISRASLRTVLP